MNPLTNFSDLTIEDSLHFQDSPIAVESSASCANKEYPASQDCSPSPPPPGEIRPSTHTGAPLKGADRLSQRVPGLKAPAIQKEDHQKSWQVRPEEASSPKGPVGLSTVPRAGKVGESSTSPTEQVKPAEKKKPKDSASVTPFNVNTLALKFVPQTMNSESRRIDDPAVDDTQKNVNPIVQDTEMMADPVAHSDKRTANPLGQNEEKKANPIVQDTEMMADPVVHGDKRTANPLGQNEEKKANPIVQDTEMMADPVVHGGENTSHPASRISRLELPSSTKISVHKDLTNEGDLKPSHSQVKKRSPMVTPPPPQTPPVEEDENPPKPVGDEEFRKSSGCCCSFWCCCGENFVDEEELRDITVYMMDDEANAPFEYPDNFITTSKYTLLSFLPLGLFFQFKKISNCYFLLNMIICFIPGVAPINPFTAVFPLVFVLSVALVKEGFEDYHRHQADYKANSRHVYVIRDGELTSLPSRYLKAGDVIKIEDNDEIRADVLLLSCTNDEGQCFIDTCNLDGETSLRKRRALEATFPFNSVESMKNLQFKLSTSTPEPALLSWNGMITVHGEEHSVSIDQFLYRGACLKNTAAAWGMVIYAGVDTKLFRNLKEKPPKSSSLDEKLNFVMLYIGCVMLTIILLMSGLAIVWTKSHYNHWYIEWYLRDHFSVMLFIYRFLSYFILMSYFIPISLFVTIELCKVVQSKWMNADNEMMEYVNGRWAGCNANTSNLNEELSLLRFIFSDKTGTLTRNIMEFKEGDILGQPFSLDRKEELAALLQPTHPRYNDAKQYFTALALCHMVDPFEKEGKTVYEGSSPDEVALVGAAADCGVKLIARTTKSMTLQYPDNTVKEFSVMACLEFTPERKMMSIVVKDDEGKIRLYNKGADSFVALQLSKSEENQKRFMAASEQLSEMSLRGLRTLLLTKRDLTEQQFNSWNLRFVEAGKQLVKREAAVDRVCLELENDLQLIGSTAIEDRLQDQVPETVSFFLSAGVIIWMLTGDKRETAITIAATSCICDPQKDSIDHVDIGSLMPDDPIAIQKVEEDLLIIREHLTDGLTCCLVIDGPALEVSMNHYFELFLEVSTRVRSAICCRLTPLQKANVVQMFQQHTGLVALAVGDGANDVSMIQEGRIGIGIRGLEGSQAALSADYAIGTFKDLRRLCAVHGRYSLFRNSSCVMISLYKNFVLVLIQVLFPAYCGFSAQTYFDGWLLTFYNVFLTSIPPFLMGVLEKDVPEEAILARPKLFSECSRDLYFNLKMLICWAVEALIHALFLFFISYRVVVVRDHQETAQLSGMMSTVLVFTIMFFTVMARICIAVRYWQWIIFAGIALSCIVTIVILAVYSLVPFMLGSYELYDAFFVILGDWNFWSLFVLCPCAVVLFTLSALFFASSFFPTKRDRVRYQFLVKKPIPDEISGADP